MFSVHVQKKTSVETLEDKPGTEGGDAFLFLFLLQLAATMVERKQMAYNVTRDILDEETLEEMAEKAGSGPPLCVRLKKSLR